MQLGVLVKDLGPSQMAADLISQGNELVAEPGNDLVVFYADLVGPCMTPHFATMQMNEAWSFGGVAIATDFDTGRVLLRSPGPKKKIFYVWDLEWLRESGPYEGWREVYGNPALLLISRSADHALALSQAWSREVRVVPNFDLAAIADAGAAA